MPNRHSRKVGAGRRRSGQRAVPPGDPPRSSDHKFPVVAVGASYHELVSHERVDQLGRGESPKRSRLGVAIAPPRVARRLRRAVGLPERDGILVRAVERGSAADRAGLERGDLIVAVAGKDLDRIEALYEALDAAQAGSQLELTIVRGADERAVSVGL